MNGVFADDVQDLGVLFAAGSECSSTSRYIVEQILDLQGISLVKTLMPMHPLTVI